MSETRLAHITIGLPSSGFIRTETTVSLIAAITNTPNTYFHLANPTGCYIHQNRENIVLEALNNGSTHVMFIDADMGFPPDAINTLLSRKKEIIGGNYNYREFPKKSTIRLDPRLYSKEQFKITKDPKDSTQENATIEMPKEPFECLAVATGFLLIDISVFKKLPRPWFFFEPDNGPKGIVGEDLWFCNLARENGYKIWCDPTIPIIHIGTMFY